MKATCFEDLKIWKEARELSKEIYIISRLPEFSKDYRFVGQITSAAGSIMDNIAEGFERDGNKEFLQSYQLPKVLVEKSEVKSIEHMTLVILTKALSTRS